ncbi:hydroxyethylthiazole kinase [Cumulibacter soli]|uniref:hydroxyethylthiazole kinase n=1 Tax=Cumulibacter soli TaxID=2546344 RepID=UPI001068D0FA|nr:hydroxyethylthiazole kinase [Cumulibacter soli]
MTNDRVARDDIAAIINAVRERRPLVHAFSAAVTAPIVADGLLAAGARPMMTDTATEAPTVTDAADALLINVGCLSSDAAAGIRPTLRAAQRAAIPWILDPAAIGRAPVRTPLARELLTLGPAAVRGNGSEVLALADGGPGGSGADSTVSAQSADGAARQLADRYHCVLAVSGAVDVITDGAQTVHIASGLPMLTRVIGTGCLLGALTAACVAVAPHTSAFGAVLAATALLTVASERCGGRGPGSFRIALLDALYESNPSDISKEVSLRWA